MPGTEQEIKKTLLTLVHSFPSKVPLSNLCSCLLPRHSPQHWGSPILASPQKHAEPQNWKEPCHLSPTLTRSLNSFKNQASLPNEVPPSFFISVARSALLLVHPKPCLTRCHKSHSLVRINLSAVLKPGYGRNPILSEPHWPTFPNTDKLQGWAWDGVFHGLTHVSLLRKCLPHEDPSMTAKKKKSPRILFLLT